MAGKLSCVYIMRRNTELVVLKQKVFGKNFERNGDVCTL